jgi:hypothetical protein
MKQDELIDFAKKAGFEIKLPRFGYTEEFDYQVSGSDQELQRFVDLIVAKAKSEFERNWVELTAEDIDKTYAKASIRHDNNNFLTD